MLARAFSYFPRSDLTKNCMQSYPAATNSSLKKQKDFCAHLEKKKKS